MDEQHRKFSDVFGRVSQALEAVNAQLRELYPESEELFDVVLMTNNHAYVGLRLINTINHHRELLTLYAVYQYKCPLSLKYELMTEGTQMWSEVKVKVKG